jgi:hypothetical protein
MNTLDQCIKTCLGMGREIRFIPEGMHFRIKITDRRSFKKKEVNLPISDHLTENKICKYITLMNDDFNNQI